jgi:hypothetical protein
LTAISCNNSSLTEKKNFKLEITHYKLNDVIVRGQTFEHLILLPKDLCDYDSIKLISDSVLSFLVNGDTLKLRPKNNYQLGTYNYKIRIIKQGNEIYLKDSFDIVEGGWVIANPWMNFLLVGEKNPVSISCDYYPIKNCRIESDGDVIIEKHNDVNYLVTPKTEGQLTLKMETLLNGKYKTIGAETFKVISRKKIKELLN